MAIAITGAKYASATLNAVGTTTITVSTTPFVSTDFTVTRLVGLWTSASVFKGMAWVRKFVSTSSLELQTEFFDPATGTTVTQVTGDIVFVSKNFAESVVAGFTVTGNNVAITDTAVTFGVAGNQAGICFYDENKYVSQAGQLLFSGGLTVFGKLDDYATSATSSPVIFYFSGTTGIGAINASNNNAHACFYGADFTGDTSRTYYVGGNPTNVAYATAVFTSCQNGFDFTSPSGGGAWATNPTRHQLNNCYSVTGANNAIMRRWGNGVQSGGKFKFTNHATGSPAPLAVLGSDTPGTYTVGAPPGSRMVVLDMATYPNLIRSGSGIAVTFNITNIITTNFKFGFAGQANNWSANTNGNVWIYFSETYTNLQAGTVAQLVLNSDSSIVSSILSSGTSWTATLLRRRWTGFTEITLNSAWTYSFKKYGYLPVSGAITPTTYSLGTAGTADNVAFGGSVAQQVDASSTLSQAAAAALTTIATLDNLYDAAINWATLSFANATIPSLSAYPITASGTTLDLGAFNLVIDATAASAFDLTGGTITINAATLTNGTKFSAITTTGTVTLANGAGITVSKYTDSTGVNVGVSVSSLVAGSRIRIYNTTDAVEVANTVVAGTSYFQYLPYTADKAFVLRATYCNATTAYSEYSTGGTFSANGISFTAGQVLNAVYNANGVDGATCTEFVADFPNVQMDVSDPDGVTSLQRLYAWYCYTLTSADGIRNFFGGMIATDAANYQIVSAVVNLKLDNVLLAPVVIVGGYLSRDDGATVIAATSGSIQMDPAKAYIANSASIVSSLARIEPNTGLIPALL